MYVDILSKSTEYVLGFTDDRKVAVATMLHEFHHKMNTCVFKVTIHVPYLYHRCGKLLKDADAVQFHAAKTEHSSFSESVEEIKPLSEEEKREQIAK